MLTRENKSEGEDGETQSVSCTDREMNVRHSNTATPLLHYTEILHPPVTYTMSCTMDYLNVCLHNIIKNTF